MNRITQILRHIQPVKSNKLQISQSIQPYHTSSYNMSSATAGYRLHHTMLRVSDIEKSKDFYTRILGLTHIAQKDFDKGKFSLHFFAYTDSEERARLDAAGNNVDERWKVMFTLKSHCIELTHNWENPEGFTGYKSGNEPEHKGFGHIALAVPDVYACCERLEKEGCKFQKKPNEGTMKGIAFVLDPDGYWVEIVLGDRSKGEHEELSHLKK